MMKSKNTIFLALCLLYFFTCIRIVVLEKIEIFSIVTDNKLQRKVQYSIKSISLHDSTSTTEDDLVHRIGQKCIQCISLATAENNEFREIKEKIKNKEEALPLSDIYITLPLNDSDSYQLDDVKLSEVSYDNFANFKKSSIKLDIGSNIDTLKINYEAEINTMTLRGLAEISSIKYDFIFNITEPILQVKYELIKTADFKIKSKSILEIFTFKSLELLLILNDDNRIIHSPNKQLLQRLADTWMVTIADAIDDHFVKPQVLKQSEIFLKTYQERLIDDVCSILKNQEETKIISVPDFHEANILSSDSEVSTYIFENMYLKDLQTFTNCQGNFVSLKMKKNSVNDYFLHYLIFTFTHSTTEESLNPTARWLFFKQIRSNYGGISQTTAEINYDIIKYMNVNVAITSDTKGGHKIKEIFVDLETEQLDSVSSSRYRNIFLKHASQVLADQIKNLTNSYLNTL